MAYSYILEIAGTQTFLDKEILFSDGTSIAGKKAKERRFHRETISETISFVGASYIALRALGIGDVFYLIINENGAERWKGKAYTTNAEWKEDEQRVSVSFDTVDQYTLVEEGMNKRFNLIDIAPEMVNVTYKKEGLIQIYIEGTQFIANYLDDGNVWEQPLPEPVFTGVGNDLENVYHFKFFTNKYYLPGIGLSPDVSGLYDVTTNLRDDGAYQIVINASDYDIIQVAGGAVVYSSTGGLPLSVPDPLDLSGRAVFVSQSDPTSKTQAFAVPIYARLLTNLETVGATPTLVLPDPDIIPENFNYSRALPLTLASSNILYSSGNQVESTKYGRFNPDAVRHANSYFTRPANVGTEEPQPIGNSDWQAFSLWFLKDTTIRTLQADAGETIINRNSYTFDSVVNSLLNEIDPSIDFQANITYSDFLYGSNTIRGVTKYPIISIKNDIKVGNYDTPAKKAEITFSELLEMIAVVWRCYYYIEDSKFIIEHEDFFEKGKSYISENIGADLTTLVDKERNRFFSYGQNNITYEKDAMLERMQFSWMDDVSKPFEGLPIVVNSPYVKKGNVENLDVNKFTTDLGFIIANAANISKDGFVLLECTQIDVLNYSVPNVTQVVDGTTYTTINGYCSFFYIHSQYYPFVLPGSSVTINNELNTVTTKRRKLQSVQLPGVVPDYMELVTTEQGNGLIDEYEESIINGFLTLKLKHGI